MFPKRNSQVRNELWYEIGNETQLIRGLEFVRVLRIGPSISLSLSTREGPILTNREAQQRTTNRADFSRLHTHTTTRESF